MHLLLSQLIAYYIKQVLFSTKYITKKLQILLLKKLERQNVIKDCDEF